MAKMQKLFLPCEVKSFDDKELIVEHFISTETEDRSGDTVDPDGMILDGVPSVLKQHGQDHDVGSEPIARCLALEAATNDKGAKGIRAKTQYYDGSGLKPPDNTGRRLYEKAKGLFMPYWSIGFIPYVTEPKGNGGRRIKSWLCVEYSQVGVPDNIQAKGFIPSDEHLVLDGVPEHRMVDGVDIDARYADAYAKGFKIHSQGDVLQHFARKFRESDPHIEAKRNDAEFLVESRPVAVVYQKQNDAWVRVEFWYDPAEGWTKDLAQAHAEGLGGEFRAPAMVEVKSLTTSLEWSNEYRALNGSMETFLGDLLWRSEVPSEKDIRKAVKEYAVYIERHALALFAVMAAMTEEQAQKCLKDIIEHKALVPADPAPGNGNGVAAPVTPPAAVPIQTDASPEAEVAEEGMQIEGADFQIVGDVVSSHVDAVDAEPVFDFDADELKSHVLSVSAEAVRGEVNKLRGRMD